jgi:hypothetical protein
MCIRDSRDIDRTLDEFVAHFEKSFLDGFPVVFDKEEPVPSLKAKQRQQVKRVVKNSNDLFVSKSIEDSYRNLFRILYDEEIELFYPKTVILKASDGKWQEDVTIKILVTLGDLNEFDLTYGSAFVEEWAGTQKTGATATVENIVATATEDGILYELFLNKSSLTKPTRQYSETFVNSNPGSPAPPSFQAGNTVTVTFGDLEVEGEIQHVISSISITDDVGGHTTSDSLRVNDSTGVHPIARVSIKSVFPDGTIKAINVLESGYSFNGDVFITDEDDITVAVAEISGLTYYPGRFLQVDGFLSDQIKIRGPKPSKIYPNGHIPEEYYQEFSYVIKSSVSIQTWKKVVRDILHPTGYAVFGEVTLFPDESTGGNNILGLLHFNQHDINAPEINGNGGFLYHLLQLLFIQFVSLPPQSIAEFSITPMYVTIPDNLLGPTYFSIDNFKFVSPPYEGGDQPYGGTTYDSDSIYPGDLEVPAWDPAFENNTQLKDIGNLIVGDFYDAVAKRKKTNICPEPFMILRAFP